ncbi:hypothetical protein NDU88_000504 [Pleurodeles waltl]|uniref:Uncharacterized protein n=1 Tax=Pleurodeles waltl TaxID=8319 RepID=A0AAV7TFN5_PLEWA|nr:hypothetical protein NDU88_000504 [Pleurodeles waltl]
MRPFSQPPEILAWGAQDTWGPRWLHPNKQPCKKQIDSRAPRPPLNYSSADTNGRAQLRRLPVAVCGKKFKLATKAKNKKGFMGEKGKAGVFS